MHSINLLTSGSKEKPSVVGPEISTQIIQSFLCFMALSKTILFCSGENLLSVSIISQT